MQSRLLILLCPHSCYFVRWRHQLSGSAVLTFDDKPGATAAIQALHHSQPHQLGCREPLIANYAKVVSKDGFIYNSLICLKQIRFSIYTLF